MVRVSPRWKPVVELGRVILDYSHGIDSNVRRGNSRKKLHNNRKNLNARDSLIFSSRVPSLDCTWSCKIDRLDRSIHKTRHQEYKLTERHKLIERPNTVCFLRHCVVIEDISETDETDRRKIDYFEIDLPESAIFHRVVRSKARASLDSSTTNVKKKKEKNKEDGGRALRRRKSRRRRRAKEGRVGASSNRGGKVDGLDVLNFSGHSRRHRATRSFEPDAGDTCTWASYTFFFPPFLLFQR